MTEARVVAVGTSPTFRQQVARALEVAPDIIGWMPSVSAVEEAIEGQKRLADVVVLAPAVKDPDAVGLAEFVSRAAPATAVIVVRDHAPDGLLPIAMRAGVRDLVDLSQGADELRDALHRAIEWSANLRAAAPNGPRPPRRRGRVISVFSSKGGTGKTFLASNIAVALSRESKKDTAVVDLDLAMGDVFSFFGKEPTGAIQDLMSLADQASEEEVRAAGSSLGPHLWGFGAAPDPATEAPCGEAVGGLLRRLRGSFPHVVVDTPAGYSDPVLAALDVSDAVLMVTGLDIVAVRHMAVALKTLLSLDHPRERLRIVLNRADSKVGLRPEEVERVLKLKVDALIPSSRIVPTSLNQGRPVYLAEPRSGVSRSLAELAGKLLDETAPRPQARRFFARR